ncbi:hypothetical protein ECHHL_0538 [Ehrlichia chaffeensis str. Heartland]|uniref:DUF3023 domain-containing protein n=1 Tax=Ehrlichia chaffeensis TaxID=945 RepID=UPI000444AC9F|nr:DUF3023 domain-containing protein [Ehrlichia chaffeensis]AHX03695.1 hypothetical protein ECHHL_0538 [Ehrlichia chaffeensis str. Heartland]AHX10404.1 hypothetical protein ECHWP_0535 [Ehrlichia chaffeensis str. West Paces]
MLGILGNNLEEQTWYNEKLCADVSKISKTEPLICYRSYCIGNTEDGDTKQLQIFVNDSYKKNVHKCFPSGKSMFILKTLLPKHLIKHHSKIRQAVMKYTQDCDPSFCHMHIYLLVNEDKLNIFYHDVHNRLLNKERLMIPIEDLTQYGTMELIYIPYINRKEKKFDMEYALQNVAGLNAQFIYDQQEKKSSEHDETNAGAVSSFFSNLRITITKKASTDEDKEPLVANTRM